MLQRSRPNCRLPLNHQHHFRRRTGPRIQSPTPCLPQSSKFSKFRPPTLERQNHPHNLPPLPPPLHSYPIPPPCSLLFPQYQLLMNQLLMNQLPMNTQKHSPWRICRGKILDKNDKVICTLPNNRDTQTGQQTAQLITLAPVLLPLLHTALNALVDHRDETTEPWIRAQIEESTK